MAGFRNGRRQGRPHGAHDARQQPYGGQMPPGGPSPYRGDTPYGSPQQPGGHSPWPEAGGGGHGQPEYFDAGHHQAAPDPFAANNPGHTQSFVYDEDAYGQGGAYQSGPPAPPVGRRLHWKDLLSGIVLRPQSTFLTMRDHAVWLPALVVTFLYGLLALFGFDDARDEVLHSTLTSAIPAVLVTGVAFMIGTLVLGVVTHTLARQFGGAGAWQPTVGLSMLITAMTDAPRLVVAMFAGGDAGFVQILGWVTWAAAGALLTLMVSRSHDLPWPKALGASALQLVALLSLIKLGTF